MEKQIIVIGSDHGGFEQKESLKSWLVSQGYEVVDAGAHELNPKDDYPQFAFEVASQVAVIEKEGKAVIGILACRSAGGVTIAANKVNGARAVAIFDKKTAVHAVEHNNANIITLSGDWINLDQAKELLKIVLQTKFTQEERHIRRLAQISNYENSI